MLFIFGKKYATVGRFSDSDHICYPCKAYDREILVQRPYFHFCLIPVFPIGGNEYSMRCRNCGDETVMETVINQYRKKIRPPFYLYSGWILFATLALIWFYWHGYSQKKKEEYVNRPAVGDVYTLSENESDGTRYYFLRIMEVGKDSVSALHNDLYYSGFVSNLSADDYFVKNDTLVFNKQKLKRMLLSDEIIDIDRGYRAGSDFNRIK